MADMLSDPERLPEMLDAANEHIRADHTTLQTAWRLIAEWRDVVARAKPVVENMAEGYVVLTLEMCARQLERIMTIDLSGEGNGHHG
jgi:hypothetical protein